jgi:hypothetical protein
MCEHCQHRYQVGTFTCPDCQHRICHDCTKTVNAFETQQSCNRLREKASVPLLLGKE